MSVIDTVRSAASPTAPGGVTAPGGLTAATRLSAPPIVTGRKRVVVAMSGGVDSSAVAAMMKADGHDVIGITLQLYDHGEAVRRQGACCAGEDIHDARRVASSLDIPHYVLDYEQRFKQAVIETFADGYLAGETPVPCIACNREIKFRDLLELAQDLGADHLATGHYVERREGKLGPELYQAADTSRDQSYFLFATTRAQLARLDFPLARLQKHEVRDLARKLGLKTADKSDSQDICFVPTGRYTSIIERLRPGASPPGDIVDEAGQVLGRHEGVMNFTVGQRRGLKIAAQEPLFVIRLEPKTARVIVGPKTSLATQVLHLRDTNWLGDTAPELAGPQGLACFVRVRSSGAPLAARLMAGPGLMEVHLDVPTPGAARGQACVAYAHDGARARVLGGGFIQATALR